LALSYTKLLTPSDVRLPRVSELAATLLTAVGWFRPFLVIVWDPAVGAYR